jgi:hypothetical protein
VLNEPGEESKPVGAPAAHSVMKSSLPPSSYIPGYDKPRYNSYLPSLIVYDEYRYITFWLPTSLDMIFPGIKLNFPILY